jgi:hypothetical protein
LFVQVANGEWFGVFSTISFNYRTRNRHIQKQTTWKGLKFFRKTYLSNLVLCKTLTEDRLHSQ